MDISRNSVFWGAFAGAFFGAWFFIATVMLADVIYRKFKAKKTNKTEKVS